MFPFWVLSMSSFLSPPTQKKMPRCSSHRSGHVFHVAVARPNSKVSPNSLGRCWLQWYSCQPPVSCFCCFEHLGVFLPSLSKKNSEQRQQLPLSWWGRIQKNCCLGCCRDLITLQNLHPLNSYGNATSAISWRCSFALHFIDEFLQCAAYVVVFPYHYLQSYSMQLEIGCDDMWSIATWKKPNFATSPTPCGGSYFIAALSHLGMIYIIHT